MAGKAPWDEPELDRKDDASDEASTGGHRRSGGLSDKLDAFVDVGPAEVVRVLRGVELRRQEAGGDLVATAAVPVEGCLIRVPKLMRPLVRLDGNALEGPGAVRPGERLSTLVVCGT